MPFVAPMLAKPFKGEELKPGEWIAEEKFDGHRMCVAVAENGTDLFGRSSIVAWSRNQIPRMLPKHVRTALEELPSGVYDAELTVPGSRSYGVTSLEDENRRVLVIFDVVELLGKDMTPGTYDCRRQHLEMILCHPRVSAVAQANATGDGYPAVVMARTYEVDTLAQVQALRDEVWGRGGEGLILKRRSAPYAKGKRTRDWLKIKDCQSSVLTLVGFKPGQGWEGKNSSRSIAVLRDDEGNLTSVKWKDLDLLQRFEKEGPQLIGKKARIEYQERTPDGGYRHPRWDRLEEE